MRYLIFYLMIHGIIFTQAQTSKALAVGYFGETLTYPGIVLEYEHEIIQSEKVSLVFRSDLGYYNHMRNHQAFFIDQHIGIRRNIGQRMFIEHSLGLGVMFPFLNAPVYSVTEQGEVVESSKVMNPDFMPSFSMGLGYDFNSTTNRDAIWVRPKMFWQYPYNTLALPHVAIQIGFTHTFNTK
ncbi:MAG: hypothetical protein JXR19_07635 [Bacteroidia bacterium]